MSKRKGPVLIEVEGDAVDPAKAPPVPDVTPPPLLERAIRVGARRQSLLSRAFWWLLGLLVSVAIAAWGWDLVLSMLGRDTILGYAIMGLLAAFLLVLLLIALKEFAGFARLRRLDGLRAAAETAMASDDIATARKVAVDCDRLYAGREDMAWARQNFAETRDDAVDAEGLLIRVEQNLLAPLDKAVGQEIEAAARQVAAITALVPLALVDLLTALAANLRMIRRIAELYGGRTGKFSNWRLTRAVLTHLVATGAVAVGDDLIGSVAGGSVLSKFSRRFGEGIINGALTARVGVAAMEVCRPMPFLQEERPTVTGILQRAATGLFSSGAERTGT